MVEVALRISLAVVNRERLNRMLSSAASALMPIALRTGDGVGVAEEHAEPDEQAKLGMLAITASASAPSNLMFEVLHKREERDPFTVLLGMESRIAASS
jgi:4-hydroxy-3-methylbut-2-enyl diphosphate reductase IspH